MRLIIKTVKGYDDVDTTIKVKNLQEAIEQAENITLAQHEPARMMIITTRNGYTVALLQWATYQFNDDCDYSIENCLHYNSVGHYRPWAVRESYKKFL